jgi:hypothetical protein
MEGRIMRTAMLMRPGWEVQERCQDKGMGIDEVQQQEGVYGSRLQGV